MSLETTFLHVYIQAHTHTHKYASHVHKHTNCDSGAYQATLVFSDTDKNPDLIHFAQHFQWFYPCYISKHRKAYQK